MIFVYSDIYCGPPDKVQYGFLVSLTSRCYDGVATYSCHHGYQMKGSSEVKCSINGWAGFPTCIRKYKVMKNVIPFIFTSTYLNLFILQLKILFKPWNADVHEFKLIRNLDQRISEQIGYENGTLKVPQITLRSYIPYIANWSLGNETQSIWNVLIRTENCFDTGPFLTSNGRQSTILMNWIVANGMVTIN